MVFEACKGLRVAITGGAGLIGSRLAAALLDGGASRVTVLDSFVRGVEENLAGPMSNGRFELVRGDVRDADSRRKLLEGADVLYHYSALRIPRCRRDPAACHDTMIAATLALFQEAATARVRRIVFASSRAVYGPPVISPVREDHPLRPDTLYGAAKLAGEAFLRVVAAERDVETVALRFFNVYGPGMGRMGQDAEVLVLWMNAIERGERPVVHDGALDLLHVDDAVQASLLALGPAAAGGIFNIGAGTPVALEELAGRLARAGGSEIAPRLESVMAGRYLADIGAARETLGYSPAVDLGTGLAGLWAWHRGLA